MHWRPSTLRISTSRKFYCPCITLEKVISFQIFSTPITVFRSFDLQFKPTMVISYKGPPACKQDNLRVFKDHKFNMYFVICTIPRDLKQQVTISLISYDP